MNQLYTVLVTAGTRVPQGGGGNGPAVVATSLHQWTLYASGPWAAQLQAHRLVAPRCGMVLATEITEVIE